MSPEMTVEQVGAFHHQTATIIRFRMITYNICGIMPIPFFMVIVARERCLTRLTAPEMRFAQPVFDHLLGIGTVVGGQP